MRNYVCVDYPCFIQTKLHARFTNKGFENTTYNSVFGILVPELLMNIISCYEFLTVKIQMSSCHIVANWLFIIYQKVLFFVIKIEVP